MGENTGISWCHHTFNPWIGCAKISPGCNNCYAEEWITNRMGRGEAWGKNGTRAQTKTWPDVRRWNRQAEADGVRRRVFPSLCDPFECRDAAQMSILDDMWGLIAECPDLDFLLLTKRAGNIRGSLPEDWGPAGWANVWLGVSVESGEDSCVCGVSRRPVRDRVRVLSGVPAVVRFVSYEPAIGPPGQLLSGVDRLENPPDMWIYGGESGGQRRPEGIAGDSKAWARQLRRFCKVRKVAFWHKQSKAFRPGQGVELDGEIIQQLPAPRPGSPLPGQRPLF
jgi:protein gp37